jgi:hypothetical protein
MSATVTTNTWSWITTPPISFVVFDEVATVVQQFQTNLASWGTMGGDSEISRRTNVHTGGASTIAGLMVTQLSPTRPVFQYVICGQPVALLQLELRDDVVEIKNLATHPGTSGAGGIMVEYALNMVTHYNNHGQNFEPGMLYLESFTPDSAAAYTALGFVAGQPAREMLLDANKSGLWAQVSGQWRLAASVTSGDTKYRSGTTG